MQRGFRHGLPLPLSAALEQAASSAATLRRPVRTLWYAYATTRTLHKETSKPARSLAPRSTRAPCRQVTALGARRCKRGHGSVADLVAPCTGAPFAKVGRRKAARGAGHIIAQGMSCGLASRHGQATPAAGSADDVRQYARAWRASSRRHLTHRCVPASGPYRRVQVSGRYRGAMVRQQGGVR